MKKVFAFASIHIFLCAFLLGSAWAETPMRIVSLAPNITEILYDLGLGDRIVAVTSFCDYPPQAEAKVRIGGMANPSLETIVALRPDIVVMTDDGNTEAFRNRLNTLGIKTCIFWARRLSELSDGIKELGKTLGAEERAAEKAERIEQFIVTTKKKTQTSPMQSATSVLFVVQPYPLIVVGPGTAIDDSLKLLGLKNIASDMESRYPKFSLEMVVSRSPDLILIGRAPGMAEDYAGGLLKKLETLEAVKGGRICYISDPLFRLSPRIIEGIREVEQCVARKIKND